MKRALSTLVVTMLFSLMACQPNPKVTFESIFNFIKGVITLPLKLVSDSLWLFSAYFCLCYLKIARYSLHKTNKNLLENSSQIISK